MKYLIKVILKLIEEEGGAMPNQLTTTAVDRMFALVSHRLVLGARDCQKQWQSVVVELRKAKFT